MQYENFEYEIRDGSVLVTMLSPDTPSPSDLCDEFTDLLLRFQDDARVRAVLLTDGLHPFDLGADLEALAQSHREGLDFGELAPRIDGIRRLVTAIQEYPKPVVAAASGCVREGGFGLFLAADCRLASASATFQPPDAARGLMPEWGVIHALPRLLGPGRTLELLWSGRTLDAREAASLGLVDRVIPEDAWDEELDMFARRLATLPQPVVRLIKLGAQQAVQFDLTSMLSFEWEAQQQCWDSRETAEGMQAYLENRAPDFRSSPSEEGDEA